MLLALRSSEVDVTIPIEVKRACVQAIGKSDLPALRQLIDGNPEIQTDIGLLNMWLQFAVTKPIVMEYLVSIGADIHHSYVPGEPENLVYFAVNQDNREATEGLRWLLEQGASPNHFVNGQVRCLALDSAADNGNLEAVKLLVKHGADVDAYCFGWNGLSRAIEKNHSTIVRYLRSVGAKTPEEQGWKPSS